MNAINPHSAVSTSRVNVQEYVLDFVEQMAMLSEAAGLDELAKDLGAARAAELRRIETQA